MTKPHASKRKAKPVKAWAGFIEGELVWWRTSDGYPVVASTPEIFRTKKQASSRYRDVRRVRITVEQKK